MAAVASPQTQSQLSSADSTATSSTSSSSPSPPTSTSSSLKVPEAAVASSSSSSSSSSSPHPDSPPLAVSPHDPSRRPSASILANPHEAPPRAAVKQKSTKSAIKAAFIPTQPGKQIKTDGRPLGKSFERKVPLAKDENFKGGIVLDYDPRGRDASAGDGIVLTPSPSDDDRSSEQGAFGRGPSPPGSLTVPTDAAHTGNASDSLSPSSPSSYGGDSEAVDTGSELGTSVSNSERSNSIASSSCSSSSPSGYSSRGPRSRTGTVSTDRSSGGSSQHAPSIRFAPLPVSGRLKRANSITIGVAARSQLLHSQGSGRNSAFPQQLPYQQTHPHARQMSWGHGPAPSGQGSHSYDSQQHHHWSQGGQRPGDVIDLGEEISKRAKSAWKKVRGGGGKNGRDRSASGHSSFSSTSSSSGSGDSDAQQKAAASTPDQAPTPTPGTGTESPAGEKTPRRPSSPVSSLSKLSLSSSTAAPSSGHAAEEPTIRTQGSHRDHFPAHDGVHDHEGADGAQTPRAPDSSSTHGLARRLSTGAFLGNASIRGMQDQRRRDVLGLEGDEEEGEGGYDYEEYARGYRRGYEHEHEHEHEGPARAAKGSAGAKGQHRVVLPPEEVRNPEKEANASRTAGGAGAGAGSDDDEEEDEYAEARDDDDNDDGEDDEDDEELREAERLAEESAKRGESSRAAGVEIVH